MKPPPAPRIAGGISPDGNHATGKRIPAAHGDAALEERVRFHPEVARRGSQTGIFRLIEGREAWRRSCYLFVG